ncbi:multidrug transporter MatE [Anditalea andensis]|uniref:Multidrug-efflux transporter n=1 Tax=Anditalea andensis TaxID=1048983 RepID=A0A074L2K8_9BACT|nr:multidrug transporter MatE [Anditalea andensis]
MRNLDKLNLWQLAKESVRGGEYDFTKLNIKTGIILLSIPMILEMIMESLFAVVDIFFVGRLGSDAIATVGLTEAVIVIVYSIGVGISMAATAIISRRFGEQNYKAAGSAAFQLLLFGGITSIVIGILGWIYGEHILLLMGASEEVLAIGVPYTRIIFAGNSAIMLLFLINGAFRGAGQAHLAMRALWIANGFNIILDPIMIFGIGNFEGLGLVGAAWATNIGRSIGVVYQLYHLLNGKNRLVIIRENLKLKWKTIYRICLISFNGMGQFLIDSVAWIALTRMVAEFGSVAVAGYTLSFRILMFSLMPAWGLSAAAATLVGQNLGAGKIRRSEISVWITARYNVIFLALVTCIYLFFGRSIIGFFAEGKELQDIATAGLQVIVLGYIFFAVGMTMTQAFNGAGDTKTPMYINIGVFIVLEIPLAYLLSMSFGMGVMGVFITIAFSHSLHALVALWFFRRGKWKKVVV